MIRPELERFHKKIATKTDLSAEERQECGEVSDWIMAMLIECDRRYESCGWSWEHYTNRNFSSNLSMGLRKKIGELQDYILDLPRQIQQEEGAQAETYKAGW